jgi:DNA-binding transcriptional LysR family regulator
MDKLKHMKAFMLAVEEGSIVKAAAQLGITKAAASKQLIDLENNLNTQLLYRTTRMLKLTDIGRLYYESLKNVFTAVADAEAIVAHIHQKPIGTLKISSHRHFGEKYIVSHIKEFMTLYPELKIDLDLADRFPDLEKENIDVLCGVGQDGPDHLVRKKISSVHHVLCASPDYLHKFGIPKIVKDLKKHRYITHSFRCPDNILTFKNNKELYLDFHIRVNDAQTMLQLALQGLGFIKIYNYFVEDYIKCDKLVEILNEHREPSRPIYLFYQQQKFLPTKIRLFIDFICKKINSGKRFL